MDDDPFNLIDRGQSGRHRDPQRGRNMLDTLWAVVCLAALLAVGVAMVRVLA